MIFTEQDLNIGANAYNIINESVSIESDKLISPNTISLVESSSIGGYVVRFNDVEELSEAYGIDYIDSMLAIAEVNGIDPQYLAVAVNEADIIMNPDLVYELANVVTIPQSENSMAYQFCEACIDGYAYTGDESYIELLVEEDKTPTNTDKESESIIAKIKKTVGSAAHKGADWIARKISALRHMYQNWQEKARKAKAEGNASWFQKVGEKVLNAIDWALAKLENLLKSSDKSREKYGIDKWSGDNIAGAHQGYDTWEKNYKK